MAVYDVNGVNLFDTAYEVTGDQLDQAYDIDGGELFGGPVVEAVQSQATGTGIGSSFWLPDPGFTYPIYKAGDFLSDSPNYQSLAYDPTTALFYKFDASTTVKVYNTSFVKQSEITMPESAGHNNDAAYYDGKIYMPGGDESDGVYAWDISLNTVTILPVTGVAAASGSASRTMGAICNVPGEPGSLFLVYADIQSNPTVHDPADLLLIYKYNISTGAASFVKSYAWDCVFVQGADIVDGIMYLACNSPTSAASSYTGITVKAIRTDTWEQLTPMYVNGNFEPEGLMRNPLAEDPELLMGLGKYQVISMAVYYSAPYRLIEG